MFSFFSTTSNTAERKVYTFSQIKSEARHKDVTVTALIAQMNDPELTANTAPCKTLNEDYSKATHLKSDGILSAFTLQFFECELSDFYFVNRTEAGKFKMLFHKVKNQDMLNYIFLLARREYVNKLIALEELLYIGVRCNQSEDTLNEIKKASSFSHPKSLGILSWLFDCDSAQVPVFAEVFDVKSTYATDSFLKIMLDEKKIIEDPVKLTVIMIVINTIGKLTPSDYESLYMHYLSFAERYDECIRVFMETGIDIKIQAYFPMYIQFKQNALHVLASVSGMQKSKHLLVPLLVANGVGINKVDKNGHTPLDIALRYNIQPTIRALVEHGAVTASCCANKQNALHMIASMNGTNKHVLVPVLASRGIDINARDVDGQTPLDIARQKGDALMANALTTYGGITADWLRITDPDFRRPRF